MTYKLYKVFLALVVCSFLSVGAFAQNSNSTIKGTVKDASGAVVSGATVTLTNIGTSQQLYHDLQGRRVLHLYQSIPGELQIDCHRTRVCRLGRRADPASFQAALVDPT